MSANGEIEIAVTADGAEDAAGELAQGGDVTGGGGDGEGQGGGGLADAITGGIVGGLLSQLLGPLLDVLSPMLEILNAFLAPLAAFLLRLFSPVLRMLIDLLPAWMEFMRIANGGIPALQRLLASLPRRAWNFIKALPGMIWSAIKSGASWLANGATKIGAAVWSAIESGAAWFANGATKLSSMIKDKLSGLLNNIKTAILNLPSKIGNVIADKVPGIGGGGGLPPQIEELREQRRQQLRSAGLGEPPVRAQQAASRESVDVNIRQTGSIIPFIEETEADTSVDN